jgi:cytochrome c oxidase assembly protein subunit 15
VVKKASRFPKTSERSVAYWLLGSAASVFGIVVWGGLTRLTESGYVQSLSLLLYLYTYIYI